MPQQVGDRQKVRKGNYVYKPHTKTKPYYKIELVGNYDYGVKDRKRFYRRKEAFEYFTKISKNLPPKQYAIFTYHYCKLDLNGEWLASSSRQEGIVWCSDLGHHLNKLFLPLEIDR